MSAEPRSEADRAGGRPARSPLVGLNADRFDEGGAIRGVRQAYADAIEAAGGIPAILPPLRDREAIRDALGRFDAFVLTGGDDIPGARHGGRDLPTCVTMDAARESADFALVELLLESRLPVLGICLGFQELNVHLGGAMYSDLLHDGPPNAGRHYAKVGPEPLHEVEIAADSVLARAMGIAGVGGETGAGGGGTIRKTVNSRHHQGVRRAGAGLIETARADDGLLEAVEVAGREFFVAVQWHPEGIADRPEQAGIFRSLVGLAAGRGLS